MIRTLRGILRLLRNNVERGTVPEIFKYSAQSLRHEMLGSRAEYLRHTRFARFPLIARRHTTDQRVFAQIFVEREYTPVDDWNNVEVVVDCGANVGYSSAYSLTAFPKSKVIALGVGLSGRRGLEPEGGRTRRPGIRIGGGDRHPIAHGTIPPAAHFTAQGGHRRG